MRQEEGHPRLTIALRSETIADCCSWSSMHEADYLGGWHIQMGETRARTSSRYKTDRSCQSILVPMFLLRRHGEQEFQCRVSLWETIYLCKPLRARGTSSPGEFHRDLYKTLACWMAYYMSLKYSIVVAFSPPSNPLLRCTFLSRSRWCGTLYSEAIPE